MIIIANMKGRGVNELGLGLKTRQGEILKMDIYASCCQAVPTLGEGLSGIESLFIYKTQEGTGSVLRHLFVSSPSLELQLEKVLRLQCMCQKYETEECHTSRDFHSDPDEPLQFWDENTKPHKG